MFSREKFNDALASYKRDFADYVWEQEKYKWEAVKCFQDNWDEAAPDFAGMLEKSLAEAGNLLAATGYYPKDMIVKLARAFPEDVRAMFQALYRDVSENVYAPIKAFKAQSDAIFAKYEGGEPKHCQDEHAISVYLWLHSPDKHYIYKVGVLKDTAERLNSSYSFKNGAYERNVQNCYRLYDELCEELRRDDELIGLFHSQLTDKCYSDPALKTLTFDFTYYVSKYYDTWYPKDYSPEISVETWCELINDREVFTVNSLEIMRRMMDYGGKATCTQLSVKYGENKNFYNSGSVALARRVAEKTGCPLMKRDDGSPICWTVLYVGQEAKKEEDGSYVWKLRDELAEALSQYDLSAVKLYADNTPAIWKISHGTERTGISDENKIVFEERNVVVVHSSTKAKASSKVTQGQSFMDAIRKGDYFYLCYGNSVQLLGQFTSDSPVENPEMKNGWYEREYRLIARAQLSDAYTGEKKWWTPNDNSTCIKVEDADRPLFEKLILLPYFGMTLDELMGHSEQRGYWWITAKPQIWSFSNLAVGEVQSYTLYNDNGNKRRIFQNFLDVKAGDMVIGYESAPVMKITAIARITAGQDGKSIYFEKLEGLSSPIDYQVLRDCPELERMEFFQNPNGSLFKLTSGEYEFIMDIIRDENPVQQQESIELYTQENFLNEVYMTRDDYSKMVAVLKNKKNIILQGAPGVGKTFAAKRLAWSMMGEKDEARIEFVQFHQNYSYEDFIMGYKPKENGFKLKYGVFYRFCQRAANQPDKDFFFIIDEINRGNMSKIFGELLMLIEKDYRGKSITLAYDGRPFSVPENLYIIGMMNTADRSLAMIDYALRRRFSFFDIKPGFDSDGFARYQKGLKNDTFDILVERVKDLNHEIALDRSLGKGFCIGHSYFCGQTVCTDEWLHSIVNYDILPMLNEYWFDEPSKYQRWDNILNGVFQ